jgi:hypothetical protein
MRRKKIVLRFEVDCSDNLTRRQVAGALRALLLGDNELGLAGPLETEGVLQLAELRLIEVDGGDYTDPRLA